MKTIFIAMALTIASASASAATCTGATINRDMVIYVQRGMTVSDISGVLGCIPIEVPGGFAWETRDDSVRRQIAVDFASATAIRARYREIPLSPGVGVSGGNNNDTGVRDAAAVALLAFAASRDSVVGSAAASGCTPVQVNPSAVQRIKPRMNAGAVQAIMGCLPTETMIGESGTTLLRFAVPFVNGGVYVIFDAMGTSYAEYMDPLVVSYNSALRAEPPLAPQWIPSAGVISP